jgi:hypothetical protein
LSKAAVERLVTKAFDPSNEDSCLSRHRDSENEDLEMGAVFLQTQHIFINLDSPGKCLYSVGVFASDSRDSTGLNRFFPFDVETVANPRPFEFDFWYLEYAKYLLKKVRIWLKLISRKIKVIYL